MSTRQPVSSARRPSAKVHRQLGRASARRRPVDYSSRRAGGEEENRRRSTNSFQSPSSGYQPAVDSYGSASSDRSPPVQRKRSGDYSSRRSGGDPENQRRRSSSYEPSFGGGGQSSYSPPAQQSSSYGGGGGGARPDPIVQRRRSIDYASRRAGGEEENRRRSGDVYASQSSGRSPSPSAYDSSPPQTSYGTGAASRGTPHVQRRKSQDYAARRAGGEDENRRRSQDTFASSSSSYGASSQDRYARNGITVEEPEYRRSEERYYYEEDEEEEEEKPVRGYGGGGGGARPRPSPQVLRRRSADYRARRSGGQEENVRRSRDFSAPSSYSQNGARYEPERRESYDEPPRRRSVDYSSRRGGGQEENRRRSGDQTFQPIGNAADRAMPRPNPQVQRRRSVDYAARRSGNQEENARRSGDYRSPGTAPPRRSVDMTPEPPAAEGPPRGRRTIKPTPRRTDSSRKLSGRERRRTGDVSDPDDFTSTPATPAWGRIVLSNLPAAVGLLFFIVVLDTGTDFDIARLALRYGGPGAPPASVASFWLGTLLAMGSLVSVITAVAVPESFTLKGKCPECGELNKGSFGDVFGITGGQKVAKTRCGNCMSDLKFDLDSRTIRVVHTSDANKAAALERGRLRALEAAKREAQAVMDDEARSRRRSLG